MSGGYVSGKLRDALLRLRGIFVSKRAAPAHLLTGRHGEALAHEHLRRQGYVMVARNWRCQGCRGEIDLVGWDGEMLCFIEVKTRHGRPMARAEAAVDRQKKTELLTMASFFMNQLRSRPQYRFDVVSVYLAPEKEPHIELFKNAFSRRSMRAKRPS